MNDRCRLTLAALRRAVAHGRGAGCERLVVLGDLFDSSDPSPPVLAETTEALLPRQHLSWDGAAYALVGNHDRGGPAGHHALRTLAQHGVAVTEDATVHTNAAGNFALAFAHQPHELMLRRLRSHVPMANREAHVENVWLHSGVRDARTPPWLAQSGVDVEELFDFAQRQADVLREQADPPDVRVFAGDWHEHRTWERDLDGGGLVRVVQVGCTAPTGFDNPGLDAYGWGVVEDAVPDRRGGRAQLIPFRVPGPRFLVFKTEAEVRAAAAARLLGHPNADHTLFVRWDCSPHEQQRAAALLADYRDRGAFYAAEVSPQTGEATARAATVARGVAAGHGVLAALVAYVEAMPLDGGLSRDGVVRDCAAFLGLGGGA
jgi:hypothetical protein